MLIFFASAIFNDIGTDMDNRYCAAPLGSNLARIGLYWAFVQGFVGEIECQKSPILAKLESCDAAFL